MFVKVKLLKGFTQPLWYKIPSEWEQKQLRGKILQVPIQNRISPAIVLEEHDTLPPDINFKIRKAKNIEAFPKDPDYAKFTQQLANLFFLEPI